MLNALLLSLLPGPVLPQAVAPGERLPPIRLEKLTQTEAHGFDDYCGRVVLLEFFAYWCAPCAASVPHLNELEEKFGPRGLSVVAVTSELPAKTEVWIEKHGAKYAYGYDEGGKVHGLFEMPGIPFAVLIDPFGTVLWSGHPNRLDEDRIEAALGGALLTPTWKWPAEARVLVPALRRGDYAGALRAAAILPATSDFDPVAAVRERIAALRAHLENSVTREEYLEASRFAARASADLGELPEAAELARRAKELLDPPEVRRTMGGLERFAALEGEVVKIASVRQAESVRARIDALAREFAGTRLGRRARSLLGEIDKAIERKRKKS